MYQQQKVKSVQFHEVAMVIFIANDIKKLIFKHRLLANISEDNKTLGQVFFDKYPFIIGDIAYLIISITSHGKYKYDEDGIKKNKAIIGKDNTLSANNIVIIMGESPLATRYSTYGYPVNTPPNMQDIFSQNGG